MPEDDCTRVSSITKQRKKRKWDQPAEFLVSAGVAVPGVQPLVPSLQQHAAALIQKIQPKIQEDLVAREIVINDAEPALRYKLTKHQTQEEIQRCTGSIVITRGKYRPPNAPPDGDKPLYLHISAGAHLKTTVERIKAVDQAAAMVEEMLKPGSVNNGGVLSTCVFLGFEPDHSLNITARIRGPNDEYVNHIMNETGATVLLRGRGSGYSGSAYDEVQQPLHLFLSTTNPKSLEHAKLLAENLLDTICTECGATRVSSCKVYGAVPPPQQLLVGPTTILSQGIMPHLSPSNIGCYPLSSLIGGTSYNGYGGIFPQATPLQQVALALRQSTSLATSMVCPAINQESTTDTSHCSEKERLSRQKRKFQELPVASEGPLKPYQGFAQDPGIVLKPLESTPQMSERNTSTMPAPKKLTQPVSNGMPPSPPPPPPPPPPPCRAMPPPPPKFNSSTPPLPPKFKSSTSPPLAKDNSSAPVQKVNKKKIEKISEPKIVPDTLISLMEYGDEDDDPEETAEEVLTRHSSGSQGAKPFWAI